MFTVAARPNTVTAAAIADHQHHIVAVGGVQGDGVHLAVASAASCGEVDVDLGHVGAAEVVDDDVVGAAECVEVDRLHIVQVHHHGGDVAGELGAATIGEDADILGDVGAVEQHGVEPDLAFHHVVAVARIPLEHVVAGAEQRHVVALVAVHEVVAVAAEQQVDPIAAQDGVVAGAAIHRDADQRSEVSGGAEAVVAAVHVDDHVLHRTHVDDEGRRLDAVEPYARAVRCHGEGLGPVAAIHLGGVDPGAALEQVVVVARVPDQPVVPGLAEHLVIRVAAGEHVVARAAEQQVGAALAEQHVVAGLAEQRVVSRPAGERVVAGAAEQHRTRQRADRLVQRDGIVAALSKYRDHARVRDGRRAAAHRHRTVVDADGAGRVAADDDGVLLGIAEGREDAEVETGADGHDGDPP
jgi:hypothetical protein